MRRELLTQPSIHIQTRGFSTCKISPQFGYMLAAREVQKMGDDGYPPPLPMAYHKRGGGHYIYYT